jgi:hypothetical protein
VHVTPVAAATSGVEAAFSGVVVGEGVGLGVKVTSGVIVVVSTGVTLGGESSADTGVPTAIIINARSQEAPSKPQKLKIPLVFMSYTPLF